MLQSHHFFILPTHGENFGHAIFEAFATGTPVIISDQTPWRDLRAKNIGWDVPVGQPEPFLKAVQEAMAMDDIDYNRMCTDAHAFANRFIEKGNFKERYLQLFFRD